MPQDYARRRSPKTSDRAREASARETSARKARKRAPAKSRQSTPQRYFHGPSFSGGVVLGAIIVIATAYAPELLPRFGALTAGTAGPDPASAPLAEPQAPKERPNLRFEYPDLLSQSDVPADPSHYRQPLRKDTPETERSILLQAASFRTQNEADVARARILLMDLPVSTNPVQVKNERWIRVTVGPFPSAVQARRAMTVLREQSYAPLWIELEPT